MLIRPQAFGQTGKTRTDWQSVLRLRIDHVDLRTLLDVLARAAAADRLVACPATRAETADGPRAVSSSAPSSGWSRRKTVRAEHETPLVVRSLVWLLILTALARPQWLEPPIERSIPTRDLLLLVDLSGSMEQQDFTNAAGQTVDRLTAVKEVLGDFLAKREGDRVGLVVFGTAPFLQVPFTTDLALCRQLLDETAVRMAGPRTALGDAIGLGIKLFENSDVPTKTILALTDGNDNSSAVPPVEAARVAENRGITIHTIAMGDPTTVGEEKLDREALQAVAQTTGGDFFLAMNRVELAQVYERLDSIETRELKTVSHRPRQDLFFWPLAAALLVSLAAHGWKLWPGRAACPGQRSPHDCESIRGRLNWRRSSHDVPGRFSLHPTCLAAVLCRSLSGSGGGTQVAGSAARLAGGDRAGIAGCPDRRTDCQSVRRQC